MTRAYISVVINGKVYAAYINHDGYPDCIAPRLMNGYQDPKDPEKNLRKIKTLCTKGEIVNLGSYIKTCDFGIRGCEGVPSKKFDTLDDFARFLSRTKNDYCYIFKDGGWYITEPFQYAKANIRSFEEFDWKPLSPSFVDEEYAPL